MTSRVGPRWLAPAALLAVAVAGCSGGSGASGPNPSVNPGGPIAVQVNSPQLRAAKAAAHIPDCPATAASAPAQSHGLPALTLPCLGGGRPVHLAGLHGPALVNFWAQWCGPCREETPLLQQFHAAAGSRVTVLGVDWQDPRPADAIAFASHFGVSYPLAADPGATTRAPLHIQGLPITLFVSRSGTIAYVQYGAVTSAKQLAGLVRQHLGVTVSSTGGR